MVKRMYVILFFVGLLWVVCGAWSTFWPAASLTATKRLLCKLRLMSEKRFTVQLTKRKLIIECVLGWFFLVLGIAVLFITSAPVWSAVFSKDLRITDEQRVVENSDELIALAKACPAEVGFYGKNLSTGETIEYRPDQQACLASIVKIFVLLEVMRQVDEGELALSESIAIPGKDQKETYTISEAIDKMIGQSDNAATAALAARVGYDRVNALPKELGIAGLSEQILPEPGILEKVLDKRVFGDRVLSATDILPQHGNARGIVKYFELLDEGKLINKKVSREVLKVFNRNPKPFAPIRPVDMYSGGKGGSIIWERLIRPQYNMVGWGLYLHGRSGSAAFCVWFEWFPRDMTDGSRQEWMNAISNGIVKVLLGGIESRVAAGDVPGFVTSVAVVEHQSSMDAWQKLVESRNSEAFVEFVESARISRTASLGTQVAPMVVCQDTTARSHFTWRWRGPDQVYGGSEFEFGRGSIWGWLPVVKLDKEGIWRFEIGCDGNKIFDQQVTVE